ncbi:MAG: SulP family inorganic anion transporter [Gammaproteobacteria bacterium]|jgi:SulP family sulfate permease
MSVAALRTVFTSTLLPFLQWLPAVKRDTFRPDIEAGVIGAILILPQSIALATLAGMPPEYGIYTSIFPVIFASLWGSSWHTLSGPNTAVCVLIAWAVAPFASVGNEYYIGYVLALTLMVGVIQLALGLLRLGAVLDFISQTVISAIILAVALIIIVSAGSALLGVLSNLGEPFFVRIYQVVHDIPRANGYALGVGVITVLSGLLARRYWKRYALVIAVFVGLLAASVLNLLYGSATTQIELIGNLSISLLPLSAPRFDLESMYVLRELLGSAFAIAFLGLMQTVVISRSLAEKSGQHIDTNQEIIGQGISNVLAPFLSSFASSGSFNRSAAHYDAGARTPMAALYASVFLALIVFAGSRVIAYIPMAAVAGALILVGYGLIDLKGTRKILRTRQETAIFVLTFMAALGLGLTVGVFIGLLLSLVVYLWYASVPNILIETHTARDGRPVSVVTIDGNLFFGSVRHVERALSRLGEKDDNNILLLRTDHLTYLDVPGAMMLAAEASSRASQGDEIYIYVTRSNVHRVLEQSGCLDAFGADHIIQQGFDHPMKSLIYPNRPGGPPEVGQLSTLNPDREEVTMEALARRLRMTRLLGPLSTQQLTSLLEQSGISTAQAGEIIIRESDVMHDHIIVVEGELEAQRSWTVEGGNDQSYTWLIKAAEKEESFGFLGAANNIRARALTDVRYIQVNADSIDVLLGWSQHFAKDMENDPELKRRMDLVKRITIFHEVPLENAREVFRRMYPQAVQAGETVVREGDKGDCYYLIDTGEAEVMRTDPFTDETSCVAKLGPGDAFGEEALLQDAYRNATVTMTTPGTLLVLGKADFDELIKSNLVEEISAEWALEMITRGEARWLDCRYDLEYEESRIPGARLIPLDRLRWDIHQLDPEATYIVYCRSGRRSKAGAFLLRERNIKALSMTGGIRDWPYEVDASPVHLA